jgi:hypothetical protein
LVFNGGNKGDFTIPTGASITGGTGTATIAFRYGSDPQFTLSIATGASALAGNGITFATKTLSATDATTYAATGATTGTPYGEISGTSTLTASGLQVNGILILGVNYTSAGDAISWKANDNKASGLILSGSTKITMGTSTTGLVVPNKGFLWLGASGSIDLSAVADKVVLNKGALLVTGAAAGTGLGNITALYGTANTFTGRTGAGGGAGNFDDTTSTASALSNVSTGGYIGIQSGAGTAFVSLYNNSSAGTTITFTGAGGGAGTMSAAMTLETSS